MERNANENEKWTWKWEASGTTSPAATHEHVQELIAAELVQGLLPQAASCMQVPGLIAADALANLLLNDKGN